MLVEIEGHTVHAIPSYKKRSYKKRLVALEEVKKRKLVDFQRAKKRVVSLINLNFNSKK